MDTGFIILGYNLIENKYLFGYVLSNICPLMIENYKIINCMYIEDSIRIKYLNFSVNFYKNEILEHTQNYLIFRYKKNLEKSCDNLCTILQSIKID